MKKEAGKVNAVPSKRLFLSIIADYDLNRALCELADNVIDLWSVQGADRNLTIEIQLNLDQQNIRFEDNAGGIEEQNLRLVVGPGQTNVDASQSVIGIFGVGSKRAVVALAQDIKITSRAKGSKKTFRLEYDDPWLETEDWDLPYYEVDDIIEGSTVIELQKLRSSISSDSIDRLVSHLGATYATFLTKSRFSLRVNGTAVTPVFFEQWAYPAGFEPRDFEAKLTSKDGDVVSVRAIAGLTLESHPSGDYGLYLYCNGRLIVQGVHDATVGYVTGQVGQPHFDVSLVRMIVYLDGPARAMPWNSSKSNISPNHSVFIALREWIAAVLKEWSSLSRRWSGDWDQKVFRHTSGAAVEETLSPFPEARHSYLPPLPVSKPRYPDRVKAANEKIADEKPWTRGLYESISAVDLIFRQRLTEKNRICLILLDSTLEIAFKEFLVHESKGHYSDAKIGGLFRERHRVHQEMKRQVTFPASMWAKIGHYYDLRCKLIHERATVPISDEDVLNYRRVVEHILSRLFGLQFPD